MFGRRRLSRVMVDGDVLERSGRSYPRPGPVLDLVASKLRRPLTRPGTILRLPLVERLAQAEPRPIVSVVAPPGYGKTTMLAQWAERNGQSFAWVSVDENDNDPKVLLTYVAEALNAVQPVGERVFDALASPASSVPGSVVPRLGAAFAAMTTPVTLVLDDVHVLRNQECRAALSVLADHVPDRSRLVLAGQAPPPLRTARLRAEGKILEIGPADLSLTCEEADGLLREAGVVLGSDEVTELYRRTEGWPVGLYLAALYLREGGSLPGASAAFGRDDRLVSEYVESEFLARIPQPQRVFLTRTAVLERMCGPLCEAVLERPGSGTDLAGLARSNLLLVPLDRRGQWYRYHRLFREMLLAELERTEPALLPVLRRRAADWYLRNGLPEQALEYSIAASDVDSAARLVEGLTLPAYRSGRVTTLRRWFGWLEDQDGIAGHPLAAVWGAILAARTGRPAEAERWAGVVDRWQHETEAQPDSPVTGWAAVLRAVLCRAGVKQMSADADEAARRLTRAGIAAPVVPLLQGIAQLLNGDRDGGDVSFENVIDLRDSGAPDVLAMALCERALLAMARHDWGLAEDLAGQARAVLHQGGFEDSYVTPLACAAQARVDMHRGDAAAARQQLVGAQRLRPVLTYIFPYIAVQARIELARVHLALADTAGAWTLMREIDKILKRRPDLGTLVSDAQALRVRLAQERESNGPRPSALTTAELRVLPMLATHLSFREIGAELFLSANTVRSQGISVYRKLGAATRSQAVTRARELGLLE